MGGNPFQNTPFAAFGAQLAQSWHSSLETWWKALLGDRERLTELAKHLGEAGLGSGGAAASADDLGKVLEALELTQSRIETLEGRVDTLAQTVETMVQFLEQQSGDPK